jgi:hypothetical protein
MRRRCLLVNGDRVTTLDISQPLPFPQSKKGRIQKMQAMPSCIVLLVACRLPGLLCVNSYEEYIATSLLLLTRICERAGSCKKSMRHVRTDPEPAGAPLKVVRYSFCFSFTSSDCLGYEIMRMALAPLARVPVIRQKGSASDVVCSLERTYSRTSEHRLALLIHCPPPHFLSPFQHIDITMTQRSNSLSDQELCI